MRFARVLQSADSVINMETLVCLLIEPADLLESLQHIPTKPEH